MCLRCRGAETPADVLSRWGDDVGKWMAELSMKNDAALDDPFSEGVGHSVAEEVQEK